MITEFKKEIFQIIHAAGRKGIILFLEDDKLRYKVAKNITPDPQLLEEIRQNKEEILQYLKNQKEVAYNAANRIHSIPVFEKSSVARIPLSYSQERLWFIDQLNGSREFHMSLNQEFPLDIHVQFLETAIKHVIERHEVLRTVIQSHDGIPYQKIISSDDWHLETATSRNDSEFQELNAGFFRKPFDLAKDYMLRALLVNRVHKYELMVVLHHIASDGWSLNILRKEIQTFYEQQLKNLPLQGELLPVQYTDYSMWQRQHLGDDLLQSHLHFWKNYLEGIQPIELQTDRARPSKKGIEGEAIIFYLNKDVSRSLKALALEQEVTLFMLMLSVFKLLLYKYTGQNDIAIGTPVANRSHKDLELLIGFFVNVVVIRSRLNTSASFSETLQSLKKNMLETFKYQDTPFESVVNDLVTVREESRSALFDIMVSFQKHADTAANITEELLHKQHIYTKYDLTLSIIELAEAIKVTVEYDAHLFNYPSVKRLVDHFRTLLADVVTRPQASLDALCMLPEKESEMILKDFNSTTHLLPEEETILTLIRKQVEKNPEKCSLKDHSRSYSYKEMDRLSDKIAACIHNSIQSSDPSPVAVLMDRSATMVCILLGILKSGRPYIPLDPNFPKERLDYIVSNSQSRFIIAQEQGIIREREGMHLLLLDELLNKSQQLNEVIDCKVKGNDSAYIIYTSGSTGNPKGVEISHSGLLNFMWSMLQQPGIQAEDVFFSVTTYSFDISILEFFAPLLSGATVYIADQHTLADPGSTIEKLKEIDPTIIQATPGFYQMLFNEDWKGSNKLKVLCGGDKLNEQLAEKLIQYNREVWNMYGPTETTIWSGVKKIEQASDASNIGSPIYNTQFYILDEALQPKPVGAAGNLYISGHGLAKGYYKNETLTAQRFIPNPFIKGCRMYETGDVGKWNTKGEIEFLGRNDSQVKIRGYRIELKEIEKKIQQLLHIEQVSVQVAEHDGNKMIVAYIISQTEMNKEEMNSILGKELPQYMLPQVYVSLEQFPLTPNGKLDAKKLPGPDRKNFSVKEYTPPATKEEEQLVLIWQKLLKPERIGITDNFFDLGGNSLLITRLVAGIRKELKMNIQIRDIFQLKTIREQAALISSKKGNILSAGFTKPEPAPEKIPLSYTQERLWYLDQLTGTKAYHIPLAVKLKDNVQLPVLETAIKKVMERHEVLRTVIEHTEGIPYQHTLDVNAWKLSVSDEKLNDSQLPGIIQKQIQRPFDLSTDFMLRANLFSLEEGGKVLLLVIHHIAFDGWSSALFIRELMSIYSAELKGVSPSLPLLAFQYSDYASWEQSESQKQITNEKVIYWKKRLADYKEINLPLDFPRSAVQQNNGDSLYFSLNEDTTRKIRRIAEEQETSVFMLVLGLIKILLYRYSSEPDICVGTIVANRVHTELENNIGFFANTIPLRTKLSGQMNFTQLLSLIKEQTLNDFDHQDVPFSRIVEETVTERESGKTPLFQTMFVFQNMDTETSIHDSELVESSSDLGLELRFTKFDLHFTAKESKDTLYFQLQYCTDLFTQATIQRLIANFNELIQNTLNALHDPIDKLPLLSKGEQQLLKSFATENPEYLKDTTLVKLFEEQVIKTPHYAAIEFRGETLTYSELNRQVNKLAWYLIRKGVKKEDFVALCLHRSQEMMIAVLAVIKAGAAYIPIDPAYPQDRKLFIIQDAHPSFIICGKNEEEPFSGITGNLLCFEKNQPELISEREENPDVNILPDNLFYMIYTSGSTGIPKGVMNQHDGLVNRLLWARDYFCKPGKKQVFLQKTTYCFDVSVWELFLPLISGAQLIFAETNGEKDNDYLKRIISEKQVNIIHFVPSMLEVFLMDVEKGECSSLEKIICSGEALKVSHAVEVQKRLPHAALYNLYGPTEAAIDVTFYEVPADIHHKSNVPIGYPVPNTYLHVLDKQLNLLPIGAVGELYLQGIQVARGYLNRPELNAKSFIHSLPGLSGQGKLYKTGDLARWLADGTLEHLGRIDNQIKIRGNRIELGEIEALLDTHPEILQSLATVSNQKNELEKILICYIVPGKHYDKREIEQLLKEKLPHYMLPDFIIELDEFPILENGKIDRKKLPQPDLEKIQKTNFTEPETPEQQQLAEVFKEVLALSQVGIDHNFYEIGGNSLKSIQVSSKLKKRGYRLSALKILQFPTIRELVHHLEKATFSGNPETGIIEDGHPVALSGYQKAYIDAGKYQHAVFHSGFELESFDLKKFHAVVSTVFEMIPELRTKIFLQDEEVLQEIIPVNDFIPAVKYHLNSLEDAKALQDLEKKLIHEPFNYSEGDVCHITVLHNAQKALVKIVIHHVVTDFRSNKLIMQLIHQLYRHADPLVAIKTGGNGMLSRIQAAAMETGNLQSQVKKRIEQLSANLIHNRRNCLVIDSSHDQENRINYLIITIHKADLLRIKEYCKTHQLLISNFLLAYCINNYVKVTKAFLIETTVDSRDVTLHGEDIEHTIGQFTNSIPVEIPIRKKTDGWKELSPIIQRNHFASKEYQHIPSALLKKEFLHSTGKELNQFVIGSYNFMDHSGESNSSITETASDNQVSKRTAQQEHPLSIRGELFDNGCILEISMNSSYSFFPLRFRKQFTIDINIKNNDNEN